MPLSPPCHPSVSHPVSLPSTSPRASKDPTASPGGRDPRDCRYLRGGWGRGRGLGWILPPFVQNTRAKSNLGKGLVIREQGWEMPRQGCV